MSDIVMRLRHENDRRLMMGDDLSDVLLDAASEIERLRKERDSAFQTWKEMHVATLDGFIKQHHEPLKAEIERLRKELAEKDNYIRTVSRPVGAHSYE